MRKEPVHPNIIRRPELQPRGQRTLFRLITLCAWAIWLYLLFPLISLLVWYLGFDYFRRYVLDARDVDIVSMLSIYGAMIVIAGVIIVGWSRYNAYIYRRKNRRSTPAAVNADMMCQRFRVDREMLDMLRSSKTLTMDIDAKENIHCFLPAPEQGLNK